MAGRTGSRPKPRWQRFAGVYRRAVQHGAAVEVVLFADGGDCILPAKRYDTDLIELGGRVRDELRRQS